MEEKRLLKRKQRADEIGNLEQLSHYCRELGEYYRKDGKYNEALQQFKEEENINVALNRPIDVAVSNRMVGEIYCDIGDFKEALKYQEKHLVIAKKEKNEIEEQRALANLGRTYFCMAEAITKSERKEYDSYLSSAKKVYARSLELCNDIKGIGLVTQREMQARLLLNIGLVLECQGKLSEAIEFMMKAIKIAQEFNLSEEIVRCYSVLGILHHHRGESNKALECLNKAVEVAERLDSHERHACEVLFSKAEVHFSMADFEGAKQALLKAYKLQTPDGNERKAIEKNLRIAAKLCETERRVLSTDASDYNTLKSLYETLGDGVVAVKNFKKAIEYYLKMLECAQTAGESGRALCPIYVSLAQTYKDDCQYDLALEYSKKELQNSQDTPQEACKTMLTISELLELKEASYVEVAQSYLRAKEFAIQAQDWKLLVTTLHCLKAYQKNSSLEDLAENTEKECEDVIKLHNIQTDDEAGSGEEDEGSAIGGSIDLDELAESEGDEGDMHGSQHQADQRSKRRRASCKVLAVKRNDKGETDLHRACIAGNFNLVRRLIERGHPVHVRDHCGWTPLHEACNHGYEDIVLALIEGKAHLNDRGGTLCGGVTPIHDAASCGHLSIVRILLSAGALLTVRTDKGETPLDCLRQWYKRVESEIDSRTEEEFRELEQEMSRSLAKIVGQEPPALKPALRNESQLRKSASNLLQDDSGSGPLLSIHRGKRERGKSSLAKKVRNQHSVGSTSRRFSTYLTSSEEEDAAISEGFVHASSSDDETMVLSARMLTKDISQQATGSVSRHLRMKAKDLPASSEYARTIASLKNRQSLLTLSKDPKAGGTLGQLLFSEEKSPHLAEGEVEVDNWLEDDLARPPLKRMKRSTHREGHVQSMGRSRGSRQSPPPPSHGLLSSEQDEVTLDNPGNQLEERRDEPMGQASGHTVEVMQQALMPSIQLVKVDVEGTLLLVPLDRTATFECLAKEVARRYHEFKGVNVELMLHTQEGAMLSKNDPVSLLSSLCVTDPQAMTLIAHVTSFTLPPITESYEKACMASHIAPIEKVSQSLEVCPAVHTLALDDMGLGPKECGAVVQVVSQHRNLTIRRLLLASNNIGDKGLKMLCQGLSAMQNLVMLDLTCNGITAVGLMDLASMFTQQSVHLPPLQALAELNLSHNPIKDAGFPHLVTVLSGLPSLTYLSLSNCSLSACDLMCCNISSLLSLDGLEQLDVSLNALGAEGVAIFLATLQPTKLKVLNVSHTLGRHPSPRKIAREVALLLTQDEMSPPSSLIELDLSQTLVNDLDLYEVIRGLEHTNLLEKIGLECNPDLTSLSLRRLLQQGSWPNLCISLSGCPKIFDYMESDASAVNWMHRRADSLMPSQVCLSISGDVKEDAVERLVDMWERALGSPEAHIERGLFGHLKLGVRSSLPVVSALP